MNRRLPMNHDGGLAEGLSHEQKFVKWLGDLLEDRQVSLVETFVSIQGEGERLGARSMFIRTSQCNLRCSWCDTKYSFDPKPGAKHGVPEGHYIASIDEIVAEIKASGVTHVVLTGGEPTVQPHFGALVEAIRKLKVHITVESNGTISPDVDLRDVDLWSIAPKLNDGSNMTYDAQVMKDYLDHYMSYGGVQIKWVSTTEQDLEEAFSIMHTWTQFHHILPPVWFHPNGMVPDEEYAAGCKDLAEMVLHRLAQDDEAIQHLQDICDVKVGLQYHRLMWGHNLGT